MKRTIWKYQLRHGETKLQLPLKSKILSFGIQGEEPVIWVQHDPTEEIKETVRFIVIHTGEETDAILEFYNFLGTSTSSKCTVKHCYYLKDKHRYGISID